MGKTPGDRRDRRGPARRRHGHRLRAARPGVRGLHGRGRHRAPGAQRRPDAAARRRGRPGDARARARSRTRSTRRCATGSPTSTPRTTCSARSPGRTRSRRWCATSTGSSGWRRASRCWSASGGCRTRSRPASAAGRTRSGSSTPSSTTRACGWSASSPAATASRPGGTARPCREGSPGALHGAMSYLLQDDDGQTAESYSISAGPGLPRRRPGARAAQGPRPGASTGRSPTPRRWTRSRCSAGPRGSSRRSSRRTPSPARWSWAASSGPDAVILVNLSGRGDKDVDTAAKWFGMIGEGESAEDADGTAIAQGAAIRAGRRTRRSPTRARRPKGSSCERSRSLRRVRGARAAARWSATCPPATRPSTARSSCSPPLIEGGCDLRRGRHPVLRPRDGRPDDPGRRGHRAARRVPGARRASPSSSGSAPPVARPSS